jgi:hypothetical protein
MPYGTIKIDTVTFTDNNVDKSVTLSGLIQNPTFSGNVTVTGTVSGNTIQGQTISGVTIQGQTISGATITGGIVTANSPAATAPLVVNINNSEVTRIDGSGLLLVGTPSASGNAPLQVKTPTTFTTTVADTGVLIYNTSTKTYPTTSGFNITLGFKQKIDFDTAQTINSVTPGGFSFVYGIWNELSKSTGNTQDIERLNFGGFKQTFFWSDANTCKQYVGIEDTFVYAGINANGRTSSYLQAEYINLAPPDGGTQTIANLEGRREVRYTPVGTSTINVTNSLNNVSNLSVLNTSAGTKTVNITNHAFFSTSSSWGVVGTTGTLNATITNLYGLRLIAPTSSTGLTITNNWGIRQEWSSAKNWFAGASNQYPNITASASGANAFLDSADSNRLYISTSSIVYKKDVEDLDYALADNIHQFRTVWYRSKCETDRSDWSWFGLIAEEVAAIEPRLVHYGYQDDAYELVNVKETVELQPNDPRRESGQETEKITKQERRLKQGAQKVPNGVAYDRLTVLLLSVVQRQENRIKDLEDRLSVLETA